MTGLLFQPGNPDELAEKIDYLYHHADLAEEMGRFSRQRAEEEYSPRRHLSQVLRVYDAAMNARISTTPSQ
jgi:glycosyltransferase involved in cell wall biosynthesis